MIKKPGAFVLVITLCFLPILSQNHKAKNKDCRCKKTKSKLTMKNLNFEKGTKSNKKVLKKNFDRIIYDKANRVIGVDSIDKGKLKIIYDEYGRIKSKNKSDIEFENFFYDKLGRYTKIEFKNKERTDKIDFKYSTPIESYKYGLMTEKIEKYEHSFYKFKSGILLEEKKVINGQSFSTKYKYNKYGLLSEIHYPSGFIVYYKYNHRMKIEEISVKRGTKKIDVIKSLKGKDSTTIEYGNGLKTLIDSNKENKTILIRVGDF